MKFEGRWHKLLLKSATLAVALWGLVLTVEWVIADHQQEESYGSAAEFVEPRCNPTVRMVYPL